MCKLVNTNIAYRSSLTSYRLSGHSYRSSESLMQYPYQHARIVPTDRPYGSMLVITYTESPILPWFIVDENDSHLEW